MPVQVHIARMLRKTVAVAAAPAFLILLIVALALVPQFGAWLTLSAAAQSSTAVCPPSTGNGKDFSNLDWTDHNFGADPPGSLVGAKFVNAKLRGAVFARQDLSNANFQGADLGPGKRPVNFTSAKLTNTCFTNANLDGTDFSYAAITCADFSNTSLMQAEFGPVQNIVARSDCRTKFVGATLDVHLITTDPAGRSNWGKSDFTRANFQNLSPATFDLRHKDITGAILAETSFINIDMTGANLTDVDFSKAYLTKAKLDRAAVNGAKLFNAQAESASFVCAQGFGNGGRMIMPDHAACEPAPESSDPNKGVDFSFAGLKNTNFTAAKMDHANFAGANLNGTIFSSGSLVQANLQSTQIPGVGVSGPANVQFGIFTGVAFNNAQLASVDFSGSNLVGAIFDQTSLNGTVFTNATMPNASFKSATLQSVRFSAAILQSAKFNGATIQAPGSGGGFGANFSCGQLGGADFKDAKISAADFANAVMPAEADCCPAASPGGHAWCGIVDATQEAYGPTTFPVLASPVTCPNGEPGQCKGAQWAIPGWQTTSCSSGGVMRRMWSRPNCNGGGGGDIVAFKDDNLKRCILATLPGQPEVLLATAQQIAQVSCPGKNITDLTGLEQFISLSKLDLSNNDLTIFTLAFMSGGSRTTGNLQSLDLSGNKLTTLDVSAHPKLSSLNAARNLLASITLNANTYLVVLDASHNALTTFNLPIQAALAYVDLSYNRLGSVLNEYSTSLGALSGLSYLDLSHNALKTIGSISGIAYNKRTGNGALRSLFLACNPNFKCGDLGVYDGTQYPAASTSMCSSYDPSSSRWTALVAPSCPPG